MSKHDNGGPAFPTVDANRPEDYGTHGMSLRDAFALAVAPTIWSEFQRDGTARQYDTWREGVAVEAYRLADEMLALRAQRPQRQDATPQPIGGEDYDEPFETAAGTRVEADWAAAREESHS